MTSNQPHIGLENRGYLIEPDETLVGFTSRVACERQTNFRDLCRMVATSPASRYRPADLASLSSLTRIPVEKLSAHSFHSIGAVPFIFGNKLGDHAKVRLMTPRFCPACVQEDRDTRQGRHDARPYFRAIWHVNVPLSCPRHDTLITCMESSYSDGAPYDFHFHLRSHRAELRQMTEGAKLVRASAFDHFMHSIIRADSSLTNPFPDLPLDTVISLTERIGHVVLFGTKGRIRVKDPLRFHEMMSTGFEYTSNGYEGVTRFLEECDAKVGPNDVINVRHLYGALYVYLQERRGSEEHRPLAEFLGKHAADRHPIGSEDRFLGLKLERKFHTTRTAALHYGVSRENIRLVVRALGWLPTANGTGMEARIPVANAEFEAIMEQILTGMTSQEVQTLFGVNPRVVAEFATVHIKKVPVPGMTATFSRAAVHAVWQAINEKAQEHPTPGMIPLQIGSRIATRTLSEIASLILDGGFRAFAFAPDSQTRTFKTMLVDLDALMEASKEPQIGQSFTNVAKTLGVTFNTVVNMVEHGLISTFKGLEARTRSPMTYISSEAIADFKARYVFYGRKPDCVLLDDHRRFHKLGIVPALDGTKLGKGTQTCSTIWLRSSLPDE